MWHWFLRSGGCHNLEHAERPVAAGPAVGGSLGAEVGCLGGGSIAGAGIFLVTIGIGHIEHSCLPAGPDQSIAASVTGRGIARQPCRLIWRINARPPR
jgi:hypothetical protein